MYSAKDALKKGPPDLWTSGDIFFILKLAVWMEFKNPLLQYIGATYVANFKSTVSKTGNLRQTPNNA